MITFQGWAYDFYPDLPVTGRWRATQFGVGLSAGTEAALRRMIALKNLSRYPSRG